MEKLGAGTATDDPAEWKQAAHAHNACCTQCGTIGKKRYFTRRDGIKLQKLCPTCMDYQRNNLRHDAQAQAESELSVYRLGRDVEGDILTECA